VINDLVGVLLLGDKWALWVAFAHEKLVTWLRANHAVGIQGTITHLTRWVATNGPDLNVVDLLGLEVGVVGVVISDTPKELDVSEKLAGVTLSQLEVSNYKIVIIHVFHCDSGCGSIECALILISVVNFEPQVDGLSVEYLLVDYSSAEFRFDGFLSEIDTLDYNHSSVDKLVRREHVEGTTHEKVVVGWRGHWETVLEKVVLNVVESSHKRV
jgi:hypothetical protein